jgi:hypothetical protein
MNGVSFALNNDLKTDIFGIMIISHKKWDDLSAMARAYSVNPINKFFRLRHGDKSKK